MSEPIGVGDFVERVQNPPGVPVVKTGGEAPPIGAIRVVASVGLWGGRPWLTLVGHKTPRDFGYDAPGWNVRCFRLVHSPRSSTLIETLLKQPAPTKKVSA